MITSVVVDPQRLVKYGLTLDRLFGALQDNNRNVGGGQVVRNGESLLVHGIGLTTGVEAIGAIVIESRDGVPVRVRDVAVALEPAPAPDQDPLCLGHRHDEGRERHF